MNIHIFDHEEQLYKEAARRIIDLVQDHPKAVLGLATGSSPLGVYRELIKSYQNHHVTFEHVTAFNLDEYVGLPSDHPQSYRSFMRNELFNHLNIHLANTHIPCGNVKSLEDEIIRYEEVLKKHPIDLQLLGIGTNGHIGFNEPGTPFDCVTHGVILDTCTRKDNARFFDHLDHVPTQAITMGISTIMKAKEIVLIATGEKKASAVKAMIRGPIDPILPASILQKHPNVHIYLDHLSAKDL